MISYWMGKPVTDYTKEELVEIVTILGREVQAERNRHMATLDICLLHEREFIMTFEQWFDKEYPESDFAAHMIVIRLSLKEVAQKAWTTAWEDGHSAGVSAQAGWQDYLDNYE
jgi:hypothetical protein